MGENEKVSPLFSFLSMHTWLLGFGIILYLGIRMLVRARGRIAGNPEQARGYYSLIAGFTIAYSIPWSLAGLLDISGISGSLWSLHFTGSSNPATVLGIVCYILVFLVVTFWMMGKKGAEKLLAHPGLMVRNTWGEKRDMQTRGEIIRAWLGRNLLFLAALLAGYWGLFSSLKSLLLHELGA